MEKSLLDKILALVKEDAKNNDKVISLLRFSWTQSGYDLTVNGYTIEYKDKPMKKS